MKSLDELARIREQAKQMIQMRENQDGVKIIVGMGTCGIAAGARETMNAILDELSKRNLNQVTVTQTGCVGLCEQEPMIDVMIPGQAKITYGRVNPDKARQIIAGHVVNGNIVGEWVVRSE